MLLSGACIREHLFILYAQSEQFDFISILVYDKDRPAIEKFISNFSRYPVKVSVLKEVAEADIICTMMPQA